MAIDWTWAEAFKIGGTGFGLVFAVLIILALAIWLVGFIVAKTSAGKAEEEKKKGE
ncbi:MAG TPA: hypothetical protein G4N91_03510 [Dehalococcoidia bacterium]|nr:hypothetical protein [Dehalococcoidia bacterium]